MSTISSAMNTGLAGIQKGMVDAQQAASKINDASQLKSEPPGKVTEAAIELKQAETQVKASAQVVQTANEMVGSLFDEMA
ncbi:hypothetical protein MNBD_GAMMA16-1999 [hydrothermal vent metagenome]|uniref:Flagellar biosynthesis protein FlgE n=1 Tax=hydrothermal vent metagenome TaxID=652676 RepID=A0A3B0Z941_9ZZZZ